VTNLDGGYFKSNGHADETPKPEQIIKATAD
jgi:hypothetical protein